MNFGRDGATRVTCIFLLNGSTQVSFVKLLHSSNTTQIFESMNHVSVNRSVCAGVKCLTS